MVTYSAGKHGNILYERVEQDGEVLLAGKVIKKKILPTAQDIIDEII